MYETDTKAQNQVLLFFWEQGKLSKIIPFRVKRKAVSDFY